MGKNAKIVSDQMACLDTLDGKFNQIGMWKIKKRICPRPKDPPSAKKDEFGNLITTPSALKKSLFANLQEQARIQENE